MSLPEGPPGTFSFLPPSLSLLEICLVEGPVPGAGSHLSSQVTFPEGSRTPPGPPRLSFERCPQTGSGQPQAKALLSTAVQKGSGQEEMEQEGQTADEHRQPQLPAGMSHKTSLPRQSARGLALATADCREAGVVPCQTRVSSQAKHGRPISSPSSWDNSSPPQRGLSWSPAGPSLGFRFSHVNNPQSTQ